MLINNLMRNRINDKKLNGNKETKILKKGGKIMDKNLFRKVICFVIAMLLIMPSMLSMVRADGDEGLNGSQEPGIESVDELNNDTVIPPDEEEDLPEELPEGLPDEDEDKSDELQNDSEIPPDIEEDLPEDLPKELPEELPEDLPDEDKDNIDGLNEANGYFLESLITPMAIPADFTFESSTEVYDLIGVSSNQKNSIQLAWLNEDGELIIAAITQTNKPIITLTYNDTQTFDSDDIIGVGDPELDNSNNGSGLIINTPDGPKGPFYVYEFLGDRVGNETYYWVIYNLGVQTVKGTFKLEINAGAGGYNVTGNNAIWKIDGSLEIHKVALDEDGHTVTPAEVFEITVTGPGGYSKTVNVTSGSYELLTGLEYGTYTATENVTGYTYVTSGPVTLKEGNEAGIITVTNTKIPKIPITVTANSESKVYDGTALTNSGYTYTGTLLTGDQLYVTIVGSITNVGSVVNEITEVKVMNGSEDVTSKYKITTVNGTLTIKPKEVVVSADDKEKVYGDTDPAFTATVMGLVGDDTISYSISREPGENVGSYTITPAGDEVQGNYKVTYETGTLKITPKAVVVKAENKTKVFGDTDPILTATVTGLVGEDTVSYSISRAPGEDIGEYTITPAGDAVQGNYTVTYETGTLKITPKAVVVKAENKTKVFGDPDPAFTATVTGFVGEDTISYSISREPGEDIGDYTITPSGDAVQGNYTVTYETGTLTIKPKSVVVKADNKTKVFGDTDPAFTATVTGLVGEDTISYSISREPGEDIGDYTITPAGDAVQGNYKVTYETGTLTITPKSVVVKADDKEKVYGDTDPALTATVTGLVGEDTINYSISREPGESVGSYTITPAGDEVQGNYKVTYETGTLTITPKEVVVTADDKEKVYGDTDPALTATVTGLVGDDTISYSISRAPGENVGSYTITPAGDEVQGNYTVTYETGTFTITPKSVVVKADDKEKVFGDTDPALTATVTGLV